MSVPQPAHDLEGHCAAIHDSRLWVLSPSGFQSLPLEKDDNAQWKKEKAGQLVTGPACVKAIPNGDESQAVLYVVGGETDNSDFSGLQRYTFSSDSWETLPVASDVLKSRTNHSAAYLEDSHSILVYAGSTPVAPSFLSSQTFLVSTQEPYGLLSTTSQAPPTHMPIIEPWNSSHAIMLAGTPSGSVFYTFGPSEGWSRYGTNLTEPFNSATRGVLIDGGDNSKVLQLYDFGVSPNTVSSIVLQGPDGRPAAPGTTVGGQPPSSKRKRALTLEHWPSYNSSQAPQATRSDCSVTRQSNGLVWVAGGNSQLPVAMFNTNSNGWVDTNTFFNSNEQQPLQPSPTMVTPATAPTSPSSTPSNTAGSGSDESSHNNTMRTLGITLGVLCGVAVVFILILLFLRWRKLKQKRAQGEDDEKNDGRMSFADRGASFMKEAGGSVTALQPPPSNVFGGSSGSVRGSNSSLAIIAGKFGRSTPRDGPKGSFESTTRLVKDKNGMDEHYEMVALDQRFPTPPSSKKTGLQKELGFDKDIDVPEPAALASEKEVKEGRKRSSGWSRYFQTAPAPNGLSHIPSVYVKPSHLSDASVYPEDVAPQLEPPGKIRAGLSISTNGTLDGQRLSHVAMRSPAFTTSQADLSLRGSSARLSDGQSGDIYETQRRPSVVSGYTVSTQDAFPGDRSTLYSSRPPSSGYDASVYETERQRLPSRGRSANFFPGAGTSYRPPSRPRNGRPGTAGSEKAKGPPPPPKADYSAGVKNGLSFPRVITDSQDDDRDADKYLAHEKPALATGPTQPISTDTSWVNIDQR